MYRKRGKKGVSPVIATILLVAIVLVLSVIIFLWLRNSVGQSITKFGKNVQLVCDDIKMRASYTSATNKIEIVNDGDYPIYDIAIKSDNKGDITEKDLRVSSLIPSWPTSGLSKGASYSGDLGSLVIPSGTTKIIVIPILRGTSSKGGEQVYRCDDRVGVEIDLT